MIEISKFYRRNEAAEYLRQRYGTGSPATLAKLACIGGGPVFRKMGRFPVYRAEDLDAWAQSKLSDPVESTSGLAA